MSEPKLISPLLDHFVIGDSISDHDGVRCYPAMREDSDEKYIVKIISIPASQVQLDALLLSGAYQNKDAALAYFKDLAESNANEAEVLQRLSKLDGFSSYEDWQIAPMENSVGYDLYLLGTYRRSVEKHMLRNPMTHLGAVNLGLDMCSALAVCRRAGCLYIDLKPSNVFITPEQTYQIGDLGFVPLDSLKYASFPDKYRSSYTPSEIMDAYSSLNSTVDIYALGLMLYQIYNNGELPFEGSAPNEVLPPPVNADYEMSEIILKACSPDPADRWQDPAQMGQALVGYMQRNGANDTPILPPVVKEPEQILHEEPATTGEADSAEEPAVEAADSAPVEDTTETVPDDPDEIDIPECVLMTEETPEKNTSDSESDASIPKENLTEAVPEESDDTADELSFLKDMVSDETAPADEDTVDLDAEDLSDETSEILAQANDLIAHEAPEPAVAPDPIEIPMPEPIVIEEESEDVPDDEELSVDEDVEDSEEDEESEEEAESSNPDEAIKVEEEYDAEQDSAPKKKSSGKWISWIVVILLLAGLTYGVYYYYENYYLQNISAMELTGFEDQLTVHLDTDIPENVLHVFCTDTYGNALTTGVVDGKAVFTGLNPSTQYTLTVEMDGFHKVVGESSKTYTTDARTNIVNFTAITGNDDGSVILNFTVDGTEPAQWNITYSAEDESEKTEEFTGHMVTLTGLTVGKEYTFRLNSSDNLYLVGTEEITYTPSNILLAENLHVASCTDGVLTAEWKAPADSKVAQWNVRCYNEAGYDESIQTADLSAAFSGIDSSSTYTIEVTAAGMTRGTQTSITANPITIADVLTDDSSFPALYLQWGFDGPVPKGGWTLNIYADGSELLEVINTEENSATISSIIPGAKYKIEFLAADGTTVFNSIYTFEVPEAEMFSGYWVTAENMEFQMCRTPDWEDWDHSELEDSDYTTSFKADEKASFVVYMNCGYDTSSDDIVTMFVIRNAEGTPVLVETDTRSWTSMWYKRYCEMDIPQIPSEAGSYTIEVYFNGLYAGTQDFTVE